MNNNLNTKDLFERIINFKPAPRTINWEFGFWGGTLNRWYKEGLPQKKGLPKEVVYGEGVPGPGLPWGCPILGDVSPKDLDVTDYFGFDEGFNLIPYEYWLFPVFEEKVIYEDDKIQELYDIDGIRKKIFKDGSSMPMWLEYQVKSRDDWEEIKSQRLNPDSINSRYPEDFEGFLKRAANRTFPLGIFYYPIGFFGSLRYLIGEDRLFTLYYDDPKLIKDIAKHLCNLWISMGEELLAKTGIEIVCFWEDMSSKNGPLISPETFREFMLPYYRKLVDFFRSKGVNNFIVDTDGNVEVLIPLFIQAGVNGMFPFEQQAGNNLLEIRKKYPRLVMTGGFDKNTLFKTQDHIDRELEKMEYLISKGGFIPFGDHLIPPNSSWENFKYYREKLGKIIANTRVLS